MRAAVMAIQDYFLECSIVLVHSPGKWTDWIRWISKGVTTLSFQAHGPVWDIVNTKGKEYESDT